MSNNEEKMYDTSDHSTLSNYNEVVSTHIRLEWNVDFEKQVFSGYANQTVKVLVAETSVASFDSAKLHIEAVTIDEERVSFTSADPHRVLGTKISVDIPQKYRAAGSTFVIRFKYSTDPEASAVQWLPASATKGGKHPYVFTQCQAIHARSLLPCMDSPGVKTQYEAVVTAPTWAKVLMSALDKQESFPSSDEYSTFSFNQPVPTSAYLIALAAGNLASRDISQRVRVWSEPEQVEAVNFEFSETEEFLSAAEEITGCPYVWTRYDVLCLPPSFPFGGMENPCLTFATPTLLAGDRSLADVIAHEIAHSWTGNLVTNHTWSHFWLNEGWTVWLERKITAKVKKNEEVAKLSAQIGLKALIDDVAVLGKENVFTQLVWPLKDDDPDDAFSSVPYEKVSFCNFELQLGKAMKIELRIPSLIH
jgi:leukotriene-A4 hydrolase